MRDSMLILIIVACDEFHMRNTEWTAREAVSVKSNFYFIEERVRVKEVSMVSKIIRHNALAFLSVNVNVCVI